MIRGILLGSLTLIACLLIFRGSSSGIRAGKKLAFLMMLALGSAAVVFPDRVTAVANAVGVGRGTDLVLYVVTIVFLSTIVMSYIEFRKILKREARMVKKIALLEMKIQELEEQGRR